MRRILVLNERDPEHPKAGGAETHVFELFSRLAARGHQVTQYVSGFPGGAQSSLQSGIQIERRGGLAAYYASVIPRLRRAKRKQEFDLVVECLNKVPFYTPLYAGIPVLALCHHLFGEVAFQQVALPIAAGVFTAERGIPWAYKKSLFLAISESSRDDLIRRGLDPRMITVSHPGIDRPLAADGLEQEPNIKDDRALRITYVGRLERYKRIDIFIEAAALLKERFPELILTIIGRGPERDRLESLARERGLGECTEFPGFISNEARDALLADSRACIFPSEKEGWGLTVIEANALGTPVVARDAEGLRDSVRHQETGLLVPSEDPADYARALSRLLETNETVFEMRQAAVDWSRRFDWTRATDDLEELVEKSLNGTRREPLA
ncbi:MAG: glycosyltransferase family 4 protein [Myxococcota bacterium]